MIHGEVEKKSEVILVVNK